MLEKIQGSSLWTTMGRVSRNLHHHAESAAKLKVEIVDETSECEKVKLANKKEKLNNVIINIS